MHLKLLKTAETSKSFENKNGYRAILTGLPNFLGERVAAQTQHLMWELSIYLFEHCTLLKDFGNKKNEYYF